MMTTRLGHMLRLYRASRDLGIRAAAKEIGVSAATLSRMAHGERTMTYTYAVLEVSRSTYDEIRAALNQAGYHQAFHEGGLIDMHGIALKTDKVDPYPWADALGSASEDG